MGNGLVCRLVAVLRRTLLNVPLKAGLTKLLMLRDMVRVMTCACGLVRYAVVRLTRRRRSQRWTVMPRCIRVNRNWCRLVSADRLVRLTRLVACVVRLLIVSRVCVLSARLTERVRVLVWSSARPRLATLVLFRCVWSPLRARGLRRPRATCVMKRRKVRSRWVLRPAGNRYWRLLLMVVVIVILLRRCRCMIYVPTIR